MPDDSIDESEHLVELWEHDSRVRERIDAVVCAKCEVVREFKIIR